MFWRATHCASLLERSIVRIGCWSRPETQAAGHSLARAAAARVESGLRELGRRRREWRLQSRRRLLLRETTSPSPDAGSRLSCFSHLRAKTHSQHARARAGSEASACAKFSLAADFFAAVDLKAELGPTTSGGVFGGGAGARGGAFARVSLDDAVRLLALLQTVLSAWKSAQADDCDDAALQKATPRHLRLYLDARSPRLFVGKDTFARLPISS